MSEYITTALQEEEIKTAQEKLADTCLMRQEKKRQGGFGRLLPDLGWL